MNFSFELVEKPGLSIASQPQLYSPSSRSQASVITRLTRPSQRQPFPSGKHIHLYSSFVFFNQLTNNLNNHQFGFVSPRSISTATILCTKRIDTITFNTIDSNWITLTTISYAECDSCIWAKATSIGSSTTYKRPFTTSDVHVSVFTILLSTNIETKSYKC